MSRRTPRAAPVLAAALALAPVAGCSGGSGGPEVEVSGAYVPQPVLADTAGGYAVLTNTGDTADRLTRVTSDISDDVSLHTTDGTRMKQVKSFEIPADGTLRLERGGNHLMFLNLARKPVEGEKVSVKLHFAESDPITLDVPVEATTFDPRK